MTGRPPATPPRPPRVSPELAERLAAVRAAMAKLRDNHVGWILDGAIEHFAKQVEETEVDIVRYTQLPEQPIYTAYGRSREGGTPKTREGELPRMRARLAEYTAILDFLDALKSAENLRSIEGFVRGLRDSGFFGRSAPEGGPR